MSHQFSQSHIDSIAAFERGLESDAVIAKRLNVSRQLVSRWHAQYRNGATGASVDGNGTGLHGSTGSHSVTNPAGLEASALNADQGGRSISPPRSWPEKTALVVEAIEESGVSRRAAFAIAGIPESSGYLRMEQNEEFRAAIFQAEANLEAGPAKNLKRLAESDKQGAHIAAAIYLERRFPRDWAKRDRLEVDVSGRVENVNISEILASPEAIRLTSQLERQMQQDHALRLAANEETIEDAEYREIEVPL